MKKLIPLFILFFYSCSSIKNEEYKILKGYLIDKKREVKFEEMCKTSNVKIPNSININTYILSNRNFKKFVFFDKNDNQNALIWVDCKEKFILSVDELNNIEFQVSKHNDFKRFKNKKLTFNNFKTLTSNDNLKDSVIISYNFSEPILSLDNNYAIFSFSCLVNNLQYEYCLKSGYVIMKNVKKRWVYYGELCENPTLD